MFAPTGVGSGKGQRQNLGIRRSSSTRELGEFRPLLRAKVFDQAKTLIAELKMSDARASRFETELVAHGDGAFYVPHIDTQTQAERDHIRILSGVYYFHRLPKGFLGGELRLFGFGGGFVDIEPTHNSLLVFPSWARHEVRPVSCPSGAFMDSRFAINCWVYRPRPGAAAAQSEPTKA